MVDVRVILLVEYDETLYVPIEFETLGDSMCTNKKIDSRTTKI